MTEAEAIEILRHNKGLIIYFFLLLVSGLGCLISVLFKLKLACHKAGEKGKVPAWKIGWLDFGLFIWCLICSMILAQIIAPYLLNAISHTEESYRVWNVISGGVALHVGMILVFVLFRYLQPHLFPQSLSVEVIPFLKAAKLGTYYFLAAFPLVWITGLCSVFFFEILNQAGWGIPLDQQPLVGIFEDTQSPVALAILYIMAILIAPVAEELVFRAGIYRFFKSRFPTVISMLLSAILFSLLHTNFVSFFSLVVIGFSLCVAYELSGNIMVPIIFHSAFNLNSIILILFRSDLSCLGFLLN
jgi:membrane protease YdiL (CAAX protease family)